MGFNLGIDLDDERVSAAVERDGTMRMVSFGSTRQAPFCVHVGRDGTITAGAVAVDAGLADPAGLVSGLAARLGDPRSVVVNGYAVTGETLMAHVLAYVFERAEAQAGAEPLGQVVLSIPASWGPPLRAALLAAANQAGLREAQAVPVTRAVERAPENARHLPEQAPALGAAVLATLRARGAGAGLPGGIGPARPVPRPSRPAAPLPTSSPTSIFDATDPATPRPDRSGAGGNGATPPPVDSGASGGGGNRLPFLLAGAALVGLLVVLIVLLVSRGGGSGTASTTGASGTTTSTNPPATSSTSTTNPPTTSSTSTTKPTSTSSTTTKPTATSTTTTSLVAPPRIGPVALADNGLVLQFGTATSFTLRFGDDADGTLSRLTALVGQPSSDTGWKQVELCSGDETRRVVYNDLELVFTKSAAGASSGSRTFQQWFVQEPGKKPDGLVTLDRIGIGSTVADLRKVYGAAMKIVQPISGDPSGLFTTSEGATAIDGITTGTTDRSWVRQMWAGTACQRVAD